LWFSKKLRQPRIIETKPFAGLSAGKGLFAKEADHSKVRNNHHPNASSKTALEGV
jgi:hypothetical protein